MVIGWGVTVVGIVLMFLNVMTTWGVKESARGATETFEDECNLNLGDDI